jgi:hypothetical protein
MKTRELFFEDLAESIDVWTQKTCDDLLNCEADLSWSDSPEEFQSLQLAIQQQNIPREVVAPILSELCRGVTNSLLLVLDGATKMAEHTRVRLVDGDGEPLGEALNEGFTEYLFETGRLK